MHINIFRIFAHMENIFDFEKIGSGYIFCFNAGCPKRDDCIRFVVGNHIPDNREIGQAVLPTAFKNHECRFFKQARIVEYAYGFEHIYDNVLRKDYTPLRKTLTLYLGNKGKYYEYKYGKRGLSPEKQQYIRNLFMQYGYTEDIVFDKYVMQYDV